MNHSLQKALPVPANDSMAEANAAGLRVMVWTLMLCTPLIGVAVYLRDGWTRLSALSLLMSVVMTALAWLLKRGHSQLVSYGTVFVMLAVATAATYVHGSVRSAAVYVMLTGVGVAGSFLPRKAAIAVGVYILAVLGGLNWMEQTGRLSGQMAPPGWAVWVLQAVVTLSILLSSMQGRYRLMQLVRQQDAALRLTGEAEKQLRASQERFKAMFRSNPAACMVQNATTHEVIDANNALSKLFGYSSEELIGHRPPRLWAIKSEFLAFSETLRENGRVEQRRAMAQRRDGSQFACLVNADRIEQGDEQLLLVMVVDLSAEEGSRLALQKSEQRFSKAFNFSPLGMTITRLSDGRFVEVNPANERVLGYTAAECLRHTSVSIQMWLSKTDREHFVNTLKAHGQLMGYETRMRSKRGEATPVKMWAELIDLEGEACVLSYTQNIAEEKRREALLLEMAEGVSGETGEPFFRSLVVHMAQALKADVVIAGEIHQPGLVHTLAACFEGQIVPNLVYALEGTPCSHAVATPGGQCFHADRLSEQFPTDRFAIGSGFESYAGVALRDADGTPIGILKALWTEPRPMTPDLQALLTIFSSRCNAELVRLRRDREIEQLQATLEQRVKERTAQLEYANRELDTFAYSVSHDLKSPLRSIDGFLHILQEQLRERMTAADDDIFQKVSASASRMGSLIAHMLSLARVSQGKLQRMNVQLNDLIEGVIRHERDRDPTHQVDFVIAPDLLADCDPRMAQIVLENMIGNAWKYAHKQAHPRIEIGPLDSEPGAAAAFYIQDNGAGFDMARVDRLFRPFTRLHSANEFEGSGIGLATVRRILERHGGFVRAQGEVGVGARFEFSFGSASAD